jgi:hypothetical protein
MAQIAKLNGRPKARRELIHSFLDSLFVFRLRVRLLRISVPIDYRSNPTVLVAKGDFIERYLGMDAQLAAIHQCGVEDNAGEPSGKPRSAFERLQIQVSGQEAVLQRILRIFLVPEQRKGCAVKPDSIAGEECRQRVGIPSDGALNGVPLLAPWRWFCFLGDPRKYVSVGGSIFPPSSW